jgi:hypothetical protein
MLVKIYFLEDTSPRTFSFARDNNLAQSYNIADSRASDFLQKQKDPSTFGYCTKNQLR